MLKQTLCKVGLFVAAFAGVIVGFHRADPVTRISFLSVGQGDCTAIQSAGLAMIVDSGPKTETLDAGERLVAPKLRHLGIERLSLIVLTHPDLDHIGGTGAVLKIHPEAKVAISSEFRTDPDLNKWFSLWGLRSQDVLWLSREGYVKLGAYKVHYFCPAWSRKLGNNSGSVCMRLGVQNASAVLTGDAPTEVENILAERGDWQAQILKVGHHGSHSSTGDRWIQAVHPEVAVISVGRYNVYRHPHPAILSRLAEQRVPVLRTDRDGDLVFEVQGGRFVRVRP